MSETAASPSFSYPAIYLASQSPRRQELLQQIGVTFTLLLADADEDAEALEVVLPNEAPRAYVERVTRLKAAAAHARRLRRNLPAHPILVADTTVALGDQILGKPSDATEALAMLSALSGQTHQVHTAIAVVDATGNIHLRCSTSDVRFRDATAAELNAYIASGEPFGKAGAYGIQGRAAVFIAHIAGSYSGIMGLPLFETAQLLASIPHSS